MWPILTHFRMHTYIAHMYEWNETLCANGTQNSPRFFFNHFDCVIISQSQGFFPGFFLLYLIFVLFRCVDAWKKNWERKKTDRTGGGGGSVCTVCLRRARFNCVAVLLFYFGYLAVVYYRYLITMLTFSKLREFQTTDLRNIHVYRKTSFHSHIIICMVPMEVRIFQTNHSNSPSVCKWYFGNSCHFWSLK